MRLLNTTWIQATGQVPLNVAASWIRVQPGLLHNRKPHHYRSPCFKLKKHDSHSQLGRLKAFDLSTRFKLPLEESYVLATTYEQVADVIAVPWSFAARRGHRRLSCLWHCPWGDAFKG